MRSRKAKIGFGVILSLFLGLMFSCAPVAPTALVVVDMQKAYLPVFRNSQVIQNINGLIKRAKEAECPVIYVMNSDGTHVVEGVGEFELHAAFKPDPEDLFITKMSPSAFTGTDLEEILADLQVSRVVFTGIATNYCFNATVLGAVSRDLEVVVVEDGHSTSSSGARSIIDTYNDKFQRRGMQVVPADKVRF